jgi:PKD repeat protein
MQKFIEGVPVRQFLAPFSRGRLRVLAALAAAGATIVGLAALPVPAYASGPGSWTQAQVNTAIDNGVAYLATQQNADGSFGSDDAAETGIALAAFGVEANGSFSNLSAAYQTDVQNAIKYLLSNQDTTHNPPPDNFGSFNTFGSYQTYSTGLALLGLSFFTTVNPGVPTAIANGRAFLIGPDFEGPANTTCSSADGSSTAYYCGGWNYEADYGRSDESNSGYAMTGLQITGGVPASIVADNINWNHHVQEIASNPFHSRNDGGADYQPGECGQSGGFNGFCSNANDSGTNLFSYADDGVAMSDPHVAAAIAFDQDVLNAYELMQTNVGPSGMAMIAHSGATEDGSCTPNATGCDWYTSGDGGYHYSLFALTKGLGGYITPNLGDPTNWYAKVADLLLTQQCSSTVTTSCPTGSAGSWVPDLRDDFSRVFATGLAVASLGKVAVLKETESASGVSVSATEGHSFSGTVAHLTDSDTAAKPSDYSASINWGDGTTTSGTVAGNPSNFIVTGSHTYAEEGTYKVTVTITDTADNPPNTTTASSTAKVADAALHAAGASPSVSGDTASGTVATFIDEDPGGKLSDYTAAISWGDGATTAGAVASGSGNFAVSGSHTYSAPGTYMVTTTIKDGGGSTATATSTVTISAQVKAKKAIKHGLAKISRAPVACVSKAFTIQVNGRLISSVTFKLDGKREPTKTVHRGRQYSARIGVSSGSHKLTVNVKFRSSSKTHSRTFHKSVIGCHVSPVFTG